MPNRIIKESICTSENLNNLDADAEIFFYRLIVACDDYGIFYANPSLLRSKCFPLKVDKIKDKDVEKWTKALVNAGLIFLYEYEGRTYLKMSKWEQHQQVRSKKSKFPTPDIEGVHLISNDINGNQMISDVPVIVSENRNRIRDTLNGFDAFWKAYPKKKSKGQAEKAWNKLQVDEQLLATMIAKIERAKKSTAWQKDGGQYIPYPASWLNAKGWEDEDGDIAQTGKPTSPNGPLGVTCATRQEDLVRKDDM